MALATIARLASAAWTIAEWAGSAVVGELVSTGFSYLGNRKLPANGVAELKRIEAALPKIKHAMSIAEALKMKDPSFCQWVENFRLAVEASEDVLDEFEYKKLEDMVKSRDEAGGSASSSEKRKSCTINDDTLERLKEAVTILDEAAKDVDNLLQAANQFGIQNLSESQQEARKVFSRETTSFLVERELFGREVEKHKIIDWLKRPTDARLSSFGIVGVGGQGKTTLVQFAYQEMRGSNHFDKTIWICVSTNFSVEDITRKMLGELGENNCYNKPLNALQETLKENIHLKKILLVLDDIWDDENRSHWDQLIAPLRFVQEGSKILFTTRMESVANLLKSVISTEHESLSLQGLGEQELRLLFQSYAFRGFNIDNHGDLQAIGDQILKILRGSPLAAKVIGCLLNSRMDHQYWRSVLDQGSLFNLEKAKDVVEVLKLSYYHLQANLQVCFRFCSIFPQDHWFDRDDLIKMWICSGFIRQQLSQEERPEDIGEEYFNLLLRKSFFEYVGETWKGGRRYVMHDLVHELAQNVSHGECCRIESNDKSITIPTTVRHVYVDECEMEKVSHLENLRSLVVTSDSDSFVLPNNLIKKSLRLLKICGYFENIEMPKEISNLVHLRYLSVDGCQPHYVIDETFKYLLLASIYKLYHLQVLEIPGDNEIAINSAIETTGVTNLRRLRYMRLPKEIMQTVHGVHKLTSLQELTFFVGRETGQSINELGTLKNLRHLSIENIENIKDHTEAKSANLLEKNNLMSLSLEWTFWNNPIHHEKIIDYLQPPPSLMELTINNYNGQRSPNWMENTPTSNLSSLKLLNCPLWKNQLFSGNIPYLKILDIHYCRNMDKLPDMPLSLIEFRISNVGLTFLPALYQNSGNNTPAPLSLKSSLRVVEIEKCPDLISLHGFLQQDNLDLQAIEELTINGCERLVHLPTHGFGKLTSLKYLILTNNPKLVATDFQGYLLPTELQRIYMGNCGELDLPVLEASYGITTLTELKLQNANIISIAAAENSFRSLKTLNIKDCPNLIEFPTSLPLSLIKFRIINVGLTYLPTLYQSSGNNTPAPFSLKSSLRVVEIEKCPNLISLHGFLQQDNPHLQSIEKLTIKGCERLVHLPTHGFGKLTSLKYLRLTNNPKLVAMDFQGYLLPTELQRIYTGNCGELDLPVLEASYGITTLTKLKLQNANIISIAAVENSFRSLKTLNIKDCPNLIEFLQQDNIDFQSIEEIEVTNCENLKHLPLGAFGKFVSLQKLTIEDSPMLMAVDNQSTLLPMALKYLSIIDCGKVDEPLLESASSLPTLTVLEIVNCENISRIPSSDNAFGSLNVLHIVGCKKLVEHSSREQAHGADRGSSLASLKIKKLYIDNLSLLLIEPLRSLSFVSYLQITSCLWMEALLEQWLLQNSSTLKNLTLFLVRNLNTLPATMVRLTVLEELAIYGADLLEELPELPDSLKRLYITGASSLKSLPATMARLTALESLTIEKADLLEELPELPASLKIREIKGRGGRLL